MGELMYMEYLVVLVINLVALIFVSIALSKMPKGSRGWNNWSNALRFSTLGIAAFILATIFEFVPLPFPTYILAFALVIISFLIYWLTLSALIADYAKKKGRSWIAFFWLSVIVGPIIMWIVAVAISPTSDSTSTSSSSTSAAQNSDSADQLKKLSDLYKEGILSKEEFESKKKELLDRI